MSEATVVTADESPIDAIIPDEDFLYQSTELDYVLCKPKLLPLKSITLQKLEKMQRDAEEKIKATREREEQEREESERLRKEENNRKIIEEVGEEEEEEQQKDENTADEK